MLNLGRRRVFLCVRPVDMRKAFDSLADLVRVELAMDPFQGDVFVFVGKDRTRAKVLIWEATGFWLCAKRLETARFRLPGEAVNGTRAVLPLTIDAVMSPETPWWDPGADASVAPPPIDPVMSRPIQHDDVPAPPPPSEEKQPPPLGQPPVINLDSPVQPRPCRPRGARASRRRAGRSTRRSTTDVSQ